MWKSQIRIRIRGCQNLISASADVYKDYIRHITIHRTEMYPIEGVGSHFISSRIKETGHDARMVLNFQTRKLQNERIDEESFHSLMISMEDLGRFTLLTYHPWIFHPWLILPLEYWMFTPRTVHPPERSATEHVSPPESDYSPLGFFTPKRLITRSNQAIVIKLNRGPLQGHPKSTPKFQFSNFLTPGFSEANLTVYFPQVLLTGSLTTYGGPNY